MLNLLMKKKIIFWEHNTLNYNLIKKGEFGQYAKPKNEQSNKHICPPTFLKVNIKFNLLCNWIANTQTLLSTT